MNSERLDGARRNPTAFKTSRRSRFGLQIFYWKSRWPRESAQRG
ncbi:hypothetical protein SynPROS91_02104 [Synechococcus sp. PROS-9-1]|nr:hypothetical protein SynPROS91_02104 [Synechococcus sp. PROS-9-1]